MGDYFKDIRPKKEEEKEELITNFNDLCNVYISIVNKIGVTTNESYDAIAPIRTELHGTGQTVDDIGQIGNLRRRIETSRIWRMDIGRDMFIILRNIEDLELWSERYIKYIEQNMDGLQIICKSAFKMIAGLKETIDKMEIQIKQLEDRIIMQTEAMPPMPKYEKEIKTKHREKQELQDTTYQKFIDMLDERLLECIEAEKTNDEEKIDSARKRVFDICGGDEAKIKVAEKKLKGIILPKK